MSRIRSRTSTTSVEATLKVETSTISPSTTKRATCWSLSAVNSSRLSCCQSVTTKSGCRICDAGLGDARRLAGIVDRELQEVDRGLPAHQALDQGAVEQQPSCGRTRRSRWRRCPRRAGSGSGSAAAPPRSRGRRGGGRRPAWRRAGRRDPCPSTARGMPSGPERSCSARGRELAAAGIDAAQHHLQPLRHLAAGERALPVGDAADPPHAGDRQQRRAAWPPAAGRRAADRIGDHGGVAAHELALQVLAVAGHQGHGDHHRRHAEGGREERRPRRAVEQPAAPAAQEPPGDHPRQRAGEGGIGMRLASRGSAASSPRRRGEEAVEEERGVVRAGRGLGVVLHGADRLAGDREALDRAVVQVDLGDRAGGRAARRDRRRSRGSGW